MTDSADRLFELLPVVHRRRDAEQGYPLRALLQVIAEQVDIVEGDIDQLYENWFIETCEDWVVPYLGELIGYSAVRDAGEPGDVTTPQARLLNKILIPRRDVANTVRHRRRKGTLALLEILAHDVAGWPARAVEFYRLLAWTQALNHQRLDRGRVANLRDGDALDLLDGPFDRLAHTVDIRRVGSCRTRGRYNIPSVGLFVWRLRAYPVTHAPAYCLEAPGTYCFTFSVLGNDAPLYTKPAPEPSADHIAGPLNVPTPIRRRALERHLSAYYGPGRSFSIYVDGWAGYSGDAPLPADALIVADLSDWQYRPPHGRVAVDPVLGRLAFPPRQLPTRDVWVDYHYGFSDDLGGGEYPRTVAQPVGATVYRVGVDEQFDRIGDALARWGDEQPQHAVIELAGGVYEEQIKIELMADQTLQLRAAEGTRPVLRLVDWQVARPDSLRVRGADGSRFTLDGLLVTGRGMQCEGPLAEVTIRHSTLVPGWSLGPDYGPRRVARPSLELIDTQARVSIERSILGPIQVNQDEVRSDPIPLRLSNCILDAGSSEHEAIGAPTWPMAHALLTLENTTVFGEIQAHAIDLAENSIFMGRICVARRQRGCMRFCYVTPGSRTPRRYRCQPDLAEADVRAAVPSEEVGPGVQWWFGGGEPPGTVDSAPGGESNLELVLDGSNAAPEIGDVFTITLRLDNHGPRDATDIVVTAAGPDCLDLERYTLSQGELTTNDQASWDVGDLKAGACAALTFVVKLTSDNCDPPLVTAGLSAYTLEGDGAPFIAGLIHRAHQRVLPRFNSTSYGTPTCAQLALDCNEKITRGADDESEMGAFHDLFQPQRAANLEARLDESVPAGMDAGVINAS